MSIKEWFQRNASTILTCIGAGGVVATVVLAVKATPKAMDKIQTAQIDKGEAILDKEIEGTVEKNEDGSYQMPELTIKETVQACWEEYVPTVAVGIGSLICIFGANVLSRKQQASLTCAYATLEQAYQNYRKKVEQICGEGTDQMILKAEEEEKQDADDGMPPWEEPQTFYVEGHPQFFESTMAKVREAEYYANRRFILKGSLEYDELARLFGIKELGDPEFGWSRYVADVYYDYGWLDFKHRHYITDDGLHVCAIELDYKPHDLNNYPNDPTFFQGDFPYQSDELMPAK